MNKKDLANGFQDIVQEGINNTPDDVRGNYSDGYHTFNELYETRNLLFAALIQQHKDKAWRASRNAEGTKWPGWFVCGINKEAGQQITFHMPEKFWANLEGIETHDINPYYDGHTSADVTNRLTEFIAI